MLTSIALISIPLIFLLIFWKTKKNILGFLATASFCFTTLYFYQGMRHAKNTTKITKQDNEAAFHLLENKLLTTEKDRDKLKISSSKKDAEIETLTTSYDQTKEELTSLKSKIQAEKIKERVAKTKLWMKERAEQVEKQKQQREAAKQQLAQQKNDDSPKLNYVNDDKSYEFKIPAGVVTRLKNKLNATSDIGWTYAGAKGKSYGLIIAEIIEPKATSSLTDAFWAELLTEQMANRTKRKLTNRSTYYYKSKNTGRQFACEAFHFSYKKQDMFYIVSVTSSHNMLYQFATWGTIKHKAETTKKHQIVLDHFYVKEEQNIDKFRTITSNTAQWSLGINQKLKPYPQNNDDFISAMDSIYINESEVAGIYEYRNKHKLTQKELLTGFLALANHTNVDSYKFSSSEVKGIPIHVAEAPYTLEDQKKITRVSLVEKEDSIAVIISYRPANKESSVSKLWETFKWNTPNESSRKPHSKANQANLSNKIGIHFYTANNYLKAQSLFTSAIKFDPEIISYHRNLIHTQVNLNFNNKALEQCNTSLERFKNDKSIRVLKAKILINLDREEEAIAAYEKLFTEGHNNIDDLYDCIDLIIDNSPDKAITILDAHLQKFPSPKIYIWQAGALNRVNKHDEAITLLKEKILKDSPKHISALEELIESYEFKKDYANALKVVDILKTTSKGEIPVTITHARVLRRSGKNKDGFDLLTTLSKKYPENFDVKNALAKSTASLGLGDHSLIRKVINPIPMSDHLIALKKDHETKKVENEADFNYTNLSKVATTHVAKNGKITTTYYYDHKITNDSSIRNLSNKNITFNPISESVYVNSIKVFYDDKLTYEGKINEQFLNDDSSELETHDKTLTVPVKSLRVGSVIKLVYTMVYWEDEDTLPFDRYYIGSSHPCRFSAYEFSGNIERLITTTSIPVKQKRTDDHYLLWYPDCKGLTYESFSPNTKDIIPYMYFGDQEGSWKDVSHDYYEHIKKRFEQSEETNAMIDSILKANTSGKTMSDKDKVTRALNFVQNQCVYRGIEFGPRGRMPDPIEKIISARSGDCKDKSLLLWHIFQRLGIECHLALANTDNTIISKIPSENQFNHVVLYCPTLKNQVIDPTAEHLNLLKHPPYSLLNNHILPVIDGGSDLVAVKRSKDSVFLDIHKHVSLKNNKLITREVCTLHGYSDSYYRGYLSSRSEKERVKAIYSIANQYHPDIIVSDVKVLEGLTTYDGELKIEITYISDADKPIPSVFEQNYLRINAVNKRVNPIEVHYDIKMVSTIHKDDTIKLSVKNKPLTTECISHQIDNNNKTIKLTTLCNRTKMPKDKYTAFRQQLLDTLPDITVAPAE